MALGLGLLVLALVSIGSTMWVTRTLDGGAAAVNEAGRLRMQAWRLVSAKVAGTDTARQRELVHELDDTMRLLREGDPLRPLQVPWDDATLTLFAEVERAWNDMRPLWGDAGEVQPPPELLTRSVDAFVQEVDRLVRGIEGVMSRMTALLNLFQFVMMGLAVAAAVLALYLGYLFIIQPLQRLRGGLQRVQRGDFDSRIEAESLLEFQELATGYNHMAENLRTLYHGLEAQVQAKTQDLQAERSRLEALYEVSIFLAQAGSLEELGRGFAQKLRRISGADAVAVRWSDETSQRYLMLGSDCLPQELVDEERCLEAGLCACGQPKATARTRVIPIISEDDYRLGNCARAGYTSLISVPIRLQQRILGEVDLFYRHEAALDAEDRSLYDALAGHLASAMESLRSEALLREAAVSEERTMLARELHDSIAQSLAFLKIQMTLLRQAVQRADAQQTAQVIDELDAGIRESTNDVRELLVHFRTRANGDDIEQALRTTLRKFELQSGLEAHLDLQGDGVALPSDVQLQVLHIVQEALSNVRKHAQASEVWVSVRRGPRWTFTVRDNGRGFRPAAPAAEDTHVGLHIMRERAQRIGAAVRLQSQPGEGTEVCLELSD
jgi:two-component system nitrate/nitrite sensor histidine kinase NarX